VDPSGKQLTAMLALMNSGIDKLVSQGIAVNSDIVAPGGIISTAEVSEAYDELAAADYKAKTPRISLDKCLALAAALPTH
jgi:hypothetical protein